jgi:hypothetical protein
MDRREEELDQTRRLEQQLLQALERKAAPDGFAGRVVSGAGRRRAPGMPRWLATAAAVILIASGSLAWRRYQGEVAREQVMEAMRITAGTLRQIQMQVKEGRP